jgi:hypothetical protein
LSSCWMGYVLDGYMMEPRIILHEFIEDYSA